MTIPGLAALFIAMVFLAAIPSISVLTVITRSLSFGFFHNTIASLVMLVTGLYLFVAALVPISRSIPL